MPVGVALIYVGFAQRGDAIDQHGARVGEDDAGLQALAVVVGGGDLVDALPVKQARPFLETTLSMQRA